MSPQLALYASGDRTPPQRTLTDILAATTRRHPTAPALDDGRTALTYAQLSREIDAMAVRLAAAGVTRGDRVGVRVPSGTVDLYVAILGVLAAGAAYVPVDADDPDERARLVFGEAGVRAVVVAGREIVGYEAGDGDPEAGDGGPESTADIAENAPSSSAGTGAPTAPTPADDAWIIFTSGSTGKPKGVAVTHRSAAAFVDAEARLFLRDDPIAPGDRVLAGLSVAFDASCEEMWLAWRHGACLVPAPRALVRSGVDLGPWLQDNRVTVVSTVPTLAALWPPDALDDVRLLIFGGEACPPELAERLAVAGREVWNTYGPTEATVVACAMELTGGPVVRIGLPLDGWDLAVVDGAGEPLALGGTGELVIGGVGLARYLDPVKDAEKYAPLPSLGWERAYRSGDMVRADPEGLLFIGRADEQVKLGGRRIELGEIDAALQSLPGVAGAAAAVKGADHQLLVGYVVPLPDGVELFDPVRARELLAKELPAALVPRLVVIPELPTRTSGKVDRNALPWPVATDGNATEGGGWEFAPVEQLLADRWAEVLGEYPAGPDADFFSAGGSSLGAARLVAVLRDDHPTVTVGDIYEHPTLGALAAQLAAAQATRAKRNQTPEPDVAPVPARARVIQTALMLPLATVGAARWVVYLMAVNNLISRGTAHHWAPAVSWWWVLLGWLVFVSPPGRIAIAAGGARALLGKLTPGEYPRGGAEHLRLWTAEQLAERVGVLAMGGVTWNTVYARALGADIGRDAELHSPPPVTGMLRLGARAAVEPEVDLAGHWLDGDVLRVGEIRVGAGSSVGARSTLFPGARIGKNARVAPGSGVASKVPTGELWAGAPAQRIGKMPKPEKPEKSRKASEPATPPRHGRSWRKPPAPAAGGADGSGGDAAATTNGQSGPPRPGDRDRPTAAKPGTADPAGTTPPRRPGPPRKRVWATAVSAGRTRVAMRVERAADPGRTPGERPHPGWPAAYGLTALAVSLLPVIAALPALAVLWSAVSGTEHDGPWEALGEALPAVPLATVLFLLTYALITLILVRALSIGLAAGEFRVRSRPAWQVWTTTQLMGGARVWLYPLYASIATPAWLRLLGMKVGREVEASTVLAIPKLTTVADGAFLADDTMVAPYELIADRFRVGASSVGERAFLGNSGMVGPGRKVPKGGLVGVLSAAPEKAKRGSSYVGMPPVKLRRAVRAADSGLTYDPPRRLKVARAAVELCRLIPAMLTLTLALAAMAALEQLAVARGFWLAVTVSGVVFLAAGVLAAAAAALAKWALVGRIRAGDRPLWSSFIWRNELADNFIELIAAPWFAEPWTGTGPMNLWLRALGSKVGRGVWCDTYWLPEADLVTLADGACVNRGCVVQTHLFHDRVMSIDTVTLESGATLGPNSVILPAASLGEHATIGPASLVMRGEDVPDRTRWLGNPIAVWTGKRAGRG